MKIVFFGTPDYVLPVLTTLHKKFVSGPGKSPIVAVVTQSPKPTGRKQYLTYSPVDKWAHERKVFTHYSAEELIDANLDMEVGILASYGEIIKKEVIDLFPKGILVIHPSLLPAYRGASPIQAAIANGDTQTGVTIFKMDEKVDHGPIITQFKEEVLPDDTFETLRTRLFERSAEVLTEMIEPYLKGKITPKTQDETDATYTKIVKREDGFIDLKKDSPEKIERLSRAMYPWPGIWTYLPNEKRLKILKCHLENGKLILDEVQLEGKNPVSWKQFEEAYKAEL
ncbi:MAG: methionyl-tRNA formyltransferase [Candidatus Woesebacteria bacterium]|nr:MAG: methionyl-tRNA formyltransferase [Candidatus Woesebacteria bacterium]